jgi:methionyl-tRNA synthetase
MNTTSTHPSIFITTSIPYVNARPHVGFAWELCIADALARYHRLRGARVRFLTGTDDNSLKNVQAAERQKQPTAEFVRAQGQLFVALARRLELSNDDFIQTSSDPRHAPAVERLWRRCRASGDVYTDTYRGLYCVGCERFVSPAETADGRCPEHDAPLEHVDESNYFFALTRYAGYLRAAFAERRIVVRPDNYQREVAEWLERGLVDFSISRSAERARGWGIRVPDDPSQVVYVWLDALANYVSALDYGTRGVLLRDFWRTSDRRIHVIGKNITRFHCVYWPAILESAGLPPPSDVVVHGFLTLDGRKIGKSLGNALDPLPLIERFGADALRYYLLRHFSLGHDGDFSITALTQASNGELADQLGNLQNRTLVLLEKHLAGVVPAESDATSELRGAAIAATDRSSRALERFAPNEALDAIFGFIEATNRYISRTEPWALARGLDAVGAAEQRARSERLRAVLGDAARAVLWAAGLLAPFIPTSAARIAEAFGTPLPNPYWSDAAPEWGALAAGSVTRRGGVLFEKRDEVPLTATG